MSPLLNLRCCFRWQRYRAQNRFTHAQCVQILPPLQTDRPDTPGSEQQPYNVGASATTARLESRSKDVPRAEEKSG